MREKERDKIKERECETPLLQHIYWLIGTIDSTAGIHTSHNIQQKEQIEKKKKKMLTIYSIILH